MTKAYTLILQHQSFLNYPSRGQKMFQECDAKLVEYSFNQSAFVSSSFSSAWHFRSFKFSLRHKHFYLERPTLPRAARCSV